MPGYDATRNNDREALAKVAVQRSAEYGGEIATDER